MKIQCTVCEAAEATVLCCADEAALCRDCDEKVHAANKLASKHERVSLTNSPSQIPKCDICQETMGYFFCLEDRALLCRKCDVAIHTANPYVSAHKRLLLTGVRVGLKPAESVPSSSAGKSPAAGKVLENQSSVPKSTIPMSGEQDKVSAVQSSGLGDLMTIKKNPQQSLAGDFVLGNLRPSRMNFAGGFEAGTISQWHLDDFVGLGEFNQNYGFMDHGSSKADSGKLGESNSSSFLRSSEDDLDMDECLGQVPDVSWDVPQVPSPPTASGLYWPKSSYLADSSAYVPDIHISGYPQQYPTPGLADNRAPKRAIHCQLQVFLAGIVQSRSPLRSSHHHDS